MDRNDLPHWKKDEDEDEEEDVSSYWITFWTRDYSGNWNKKQEINHGGELVLEQTKKRHDVTLK